VRAAYQKILKPILFRFDPERVHDWFVAIGSGLGKSRWARALIGSVYGYHQEDAAVVVDGIRYRTPVVLAAGFDYNGQLTQILPHVAFGGVEVGSVTARRCEGNPRPRLTRLIRSKSLLVSKGLRNEGSVRILERLKAQPSTPGFVVGVSIARTNDQEAATLEGGIADYVTTLRRLKESDVGDYATINISCPNVFGGESFADPERLGKLLEAINDVGYHEPIYLKMPIDPLWGLRAIAGGRGAVGDRWSRDR
jgi:dihydroorotate dehydrogenase